MSRYARIAQIYDQFVGTDYIERAMDPEDYPVTAVVRDLFSRHQVPQKGKSVLDLACGPGTLKACSDFRKYVGVDLSPDMLAAASAAGYAELTEAEIGAYAAVAGDRSYDMVCCLSATYFLSGEETAELLADMRRISRGWWLVSFDGVPAEEIALYSRHGVPMYNHVGLELPGVVERITVPGWKAVATGEKLPMEFVLGRV